MIEATASDVQGPERDQVVVVLAAPCSPRAPADDLTPSGARFAEFVGHELRNPLTAITTFAELVLDRHGAELDSEARGHLRRIVGAADQMRGSIDGVTSLFREDPGHVVTLVDTAALVREVVDCGADLTAGPEVAVDIGALPVVRGRSGQLRLVFENLIGNAVKYRRPDTPLRIRVRAMRGGRHIRFSVTDNGIGIPPQDRRRVFDLGYRAASGGDVAGTGVGLALCRRVVRQHGGAIWVDCGAHTGTRICFTLPDRLT